VRIIRYLDRSGRAGYAAQEGDGSARVIEGDPFGGVFGDLRVTNKAADVARLLAPVEPAAVLCIGLNYRRHAAESNLPVPEYPVLFFKTPTSVQHPGGPITLPRNLGSDEVDYECELAVVIGKTCKDATELTALDYVLGYTCANDVSARDWQMRKGGTQWSRGKTFDTFCPLGPVLTTADEIPDPNALGIRTRLNGDTVQDSNTADMIFSVRQIIAFLSADTTLAPGTVILTGTPEGVGMASKPPRWLRPGDEVTIEIDGIGALTNRVE